MRLTTICYVAIAIPAAAALAQTLAWMPPAAAQTQMTEEQAQLQLQMATINYQRVLLEKQQRSIADWQKAFAAWCGARPACGLTAPPAAQPAAQPKLPLAHSAPNLMQSKPGAPPKR